MAELDRDRPDPPAQLAVGVGVAPDGQLSVTVRAPGGTAFLSTVDAERMALALRDGARQVRAASS